MKGCVDNIAVCIHKAPGGVSALINVSVISVSFQYRSLANRDGDTWVTVAFFKTALLWSEWSFLLLFINNCEANEVFITIWRNMKRNEIQLDYMNIFSNKNV